MANTRSARKAIRAAERRRRRNAPIRMLARTRVRQARELLAARELEAASEGVKAAVSRLDGAAQKGVIHRNNAARRKSRLVKQLNRLAAAPVVEAAPSKPTRARRAAAAAPRATAAPKATRATAGSRARSAPAKKIASAPQSSPVAKSTRAPKAPSEAKAAPKKTPSPRARGSAE